MKIGRFDIAGAPTWAVIDLDEGTARPLPGPLADWAPALSPGGSGVVDLGGPVPLEGVTALVPVEPTARVLGLGMNYRAHLERFGVPVPSSPLCFLKPISALVGDGDEIAYPPTTTQLDYELELVAVVGRPELADPDHGSASLLGYMVGNDTSARDARFRDGPDLFAMKALDRCSPVGPWIVTVDELGPGQVDLEMTLAVNGDVRQHDRTSRMIFDIDQSLRYLDDRVALRAGDIVFTGTTAGVGSEDGRYLEPGDVVEATIEGIGTLRNVVGPRTAARAGASA